MVAGRWRERGAVGRQGCHRDDPGREAGGEALAEEGAERLVLPGLDVAGGPVVEEGEAEEVRFSFGDGDGRAEGVAGADGCGDFELVVELVGGLEDGRGLGASLSWP